jgi:hypothetical protein
MRDITDVGRDGPENRSRTGAKEDQMSATAPRTASTAPDLRQLGAAMGALILAVALVVGVAISSQAAIEPPTIVPPTVHDQGWSTAGGQAPAVKGTDGNGFWYTGIPYPAPDHGTVLSGRERFAR